MCGIAGFLGQFDAELLHRMSSVLEHRGPDDAGVWASLDAGIGLAHRRLTIIDLSDRGHQPMWDVTGSVAIVFNGEIYNYRELRKPLESAGYGFRGESDTEVLLNLYLRDVHTGQLVTAVSADMRGNTDESWSRATDYLVRNRLLAPNYGAPQAR